MARLYFIPDSSAIPFQRNDGTETIKISSFAQPNNQCMIQQIKGIITDATPLGTIETRTGRKTEKCILHIRTADIDPNKVQEIAVGVHGDNAKFQFLIGTMVTVEYIVRVFTFLKNGRRQLGNDIYCKSIKTSIHENQM